ncbi:hypothetical protein KAJ27_04860 [bacterium]|nr:hypothetical protein [bacterium]
MKVMGKMKLEELIAYIYYKISTAVRRLLAKTKARTFLPTHLPPDKLTSKQLNLSFV